MRKPVFLPIRLFQTFERQNQQFRVVLIGQRRKGNRRKSPTFKPMHRCGINSHSLFRSNIGTILSAPPPFLSAIHFKEPYVFYLQIIVLSFLFRFEIESRQTTEILLADRLIDGGAASNSLAIIMRRIRPPIGLRFHVAKDHVFDGKRQSGNFPRDIGFPAAPRFAQMLQNGSRFVLLDSLRHHIQNIVHHLDNDNN